MLYKYMKEKVLTVSRIPSSYQMCFLILSHNEKNKVERELKRRSCIMQVLTCSDIRMFRV
jgi:hypothetical protein